MKKKPIPFKPKFDLLTPGLPKPNLTNPGDVKQGSMTLKANHTWTAPDGYKVVVLDRGAVLFNIPQKWVVTDSDPFTIRDAKVPDDEAGLQVSYWRLPIGVDWSGLPLAPMLMEAVKGSTQEKLFQSEIFQPKRDDFEIAWMEQRFLDEPQQREAFSRTAVVRGSNVQAVLTLSFWVTDRHWCLPIWEEVIRSLQLGLIIDDPTRGVTRH